MADEPDPQPLTESTAPQSSSAPGVPKQRTAVRWLSPGQLLRTGLEVISSTYFARFADQRQLESATPRNAYDLATKLVAASGSDQEVFIDYVADTGDGFNATYTVACSVAGAHDVVAPPDAGPYDSDLDCPSCTERNEAGQLLVFGGDQVYPVAAVREYTERFVNVFRTAAKVVDLPRARYVAAIPGNHDWYDGLVAFRRIFCESWVHYTPSEEFLEQPPEDRRLDNAAGWKTVQSRSYFAVKLPHNWWFWGIDIQLDAPIDAAQLDYFRRAAKELDPEARLIIATARPSWLDPDRANDPAVLSNRQNLAWFLQRILAPGTEGKPGARELGLSRVRLLIAGDIHHYARYEPSSERAAVDTKTPCVRPPNFAPELVTCGGGGAYMSSTHHLPDPITPFWDPAHKLETWDQSFRGTKRFPTKKESKNLRNRLVFAAPFINGTLPVFCGVLYGLMLWTLALAMPNDDRWLLSRLAWIGDLKWAWPDPSQLVRVTPFAIAFIALLLLLHAFASYGAHGRKGRAWLASIGHTLAHTAVAVLAAWPLGLLSREIEGSNWRSAYQSLAAGGGIVAFLLALGLVGAFVLSAYLLLSDVFDLHETECASSFAYPGYKCHLRIHVTEDDLHVRVLGIRKASKFRRGSLVPKAGHPTQSEVIDAFRIPRDATGNFRSAADFRFD